MVLGQNELVRRLTGQTGAEPLRVIPILNWPPPGDAGIDLHIGSHFLFPEKPLVDVVDPIDWTEGEGKGWRSAYVPLDRNVVLHPGEFALAATFEYVRLPSDLTADVIGRSRWARVGLVIAMATFVHPHYTGCLTLELQNLGSAPLKIRPGDAVAQLVFMECKDAGQSDRPPACEIGPRPRQLTRDHERRVLWAFGHKVPPPPGGGP